MINNKRLVILLLTIALTGLLFYFKSFFIVALVNYRPITRYSLDRELERRGGNDVLDAQIAELLILEEAKSKKISPSKAQIDQRVGEINDQLKQQGQEGIDAVLALQNISKNDFRRQVMIQLIIERLLQERIKITDDDIKTYFENNKSFYPKGTTLESKEEEIKKSLYRQKLAQEIPVLIEELKQKAKIYRFISF